MASLARDVEEAYRRAGVRVIAWEWREGETACDG